MALNYFKVEKGLKITEAGSEVGVLLLIGSGAPSLDAPIGSLYSDESAGGHYQKMAAGSGADKWKELATKEDVQATIGTWRPERVVLLTGEAQAPGVRDVVANPFSDDQGTAVPLSAYVVGKHIISDAVLLEITDVTGDNVTFSAAASPMVKDDTFVCEYYLPDSELQEGLAIVNYNGSAMVKIADADWGRADGIALAPSYAAVNGSITSADSVESALEKLDGNQQDLVTLSGVAQGEIDLGVFTGTTIADGQTVKAALQDLETASEAIADDVSHLVTLSGVAVDSNELGVFTGDIIADGQTVKAALQDLETELVATRDNTDALVTLSGEVEGSTSYNVSPANISATFHGVDYGDNVLVSGSAHQQFNDINYYLSHLNQWVKTISTADAWVDIFHVESLFSYALTMKLAMQFEPQKAGATLPVVGLELMSTHSLAVDAADCESDFTVYAKVKTAKRFGVAITEDFNPELRFNVTTVDTRQAVALQIKLPAGYSSCDISIRPLLLSRFAF